MFTRSARLVSAPRLLSSTKLLHTPWFYQLSKVSSTHTGLHNPAGLPRSAIFPEQRSCPTPTGSPDLPSCSRYLPHISKASSYQQMPDLGRPSGLCKPVWVGETLVSWENQGVWRSLVELGNLGELSNLNMAYLGRPAGLINCVSWGNFAELENMASTQDQQVPKCHFSRNPGETTWCHLQKNSTTQSQT